MNFYFGSLILWKSWQSFSKMAHLYIYTSIKWCALCFYVHTHVHGVNWKYLFKLWRRRRKFALTQKPQSPHPVHPALQNPPLRVMLRMKGAGGKRGKEELKPNSPGNEGRRRGRRRIQGASEPQAKDGDWSLKSNNCTKIWGILLCFHEVLKQ